MNVSHWIYNIKCSIFSARIHGFYLFTGMFYFSLWQRFIFLALSVECVQRVELSSVMKTFWTIYWWIAIPIKCHSINHMASIERQFITNCALLFFLSIGHFGYFSFSLLIDVSIEQLQKKGTMSEYPSSCFYARKFLLFILAALLALANVIAAIECNIVCFQSHYSLFGCSNISSICFLPCCRFFTCFERLNRAKRISMDSCPLTMAFASWTVFVFSFHFANPQ